MKRIIIFLLAVLIVSSLLLTSCDGKKIINNNNPPFEPSYETGSAPETTDPFVITEPIPEDAVKITLTVNGKEFTAALEDGVTAEAFVKMLPMTLNMSELNGNEKYRYLDSSLSASPRHYGSIKSGDIMLYGDNCLVIFYESFQTIYSYTRIGRIIDVSGLEEALGTGDVTITFTP